MPPPTSAAIVLVLAFLASAATSSTAAEPPPRKHSNLERLSLERWRPSTPTSRSSSRGGSRSRPGPG